MKKPHSVSPEISWIFCLFGLWALFNYRILFLGHSFVLKDASLLFYPLWAWGARAFQSGHIPLWNPDAGFGTPYACDPESALWYPPLRLFFWLLSPGDAFRFCLAAHRLFGMMGFYLYMRGRGRSPQASFLSAFCFGFSIHAVSAASCSPLAFTFAWLPWIFHFLKKHLEGKKTSWLFLSIGLAMQMAAGYPIVSYLTLLVLGLETLPLLLCGPQVERKKVLGLLGSIFPALLYNAAWFLPFVEFKPFSNLAVRSEMKWDLSLQALGTWFNPFLLGHPFHSGEGFLIELSSFFIGLPVVAWITWALIRRKIGGSGIPVLAAVLILSLGGWLAHGVSAWIPLYGLVVRSGYWVPLVVFLASRLAADSAEAVLDVENRGFGLAWFTAGLGTYLMAVALGVPMDLWSLWASLALFLLAGFESARRYRAALLTAALFASLWPAAQGVQFTLPKEFLEEPSGMALRMEKPGRIYEPFTVVEGAKSFWGRNLEEACESSKNSMISNWPLAFGKEECFFYESFFLKKYFEWCFSSMRYSLTVSRKVLDYLGVRYILGRQDFPDFKDLSRKGELLPLSENPKENTKWFSIAKAYPQVGWGVDLAKLDQKGMDLETSCFISKQGLIGSYALRMVREMERNPNRVVLEAAGKGRAFLASSEMDYPGWIAEVAGKPIPVEEVNYGFRGVVLGEGEEVVTMSYRPGTFRLGCFLMLLACGIWIGIGVRQIRSYR